MPSRLRLLTLSLALLALGGGLSFALRRAAALGGAAAVVAAPAAAPPAATSIDLRAVQFSGAALPTSLVVDIASDEFDSDFGPGDLSLREAVSLANSGIGGGMVTFDASLAG
jgi:hypothetical protein